MPWNYFLTCFLLNNNLFTFPHSFGYITQHTSEDRNIRYQTLSSLKNICIYDVFHSQFFSISPRNVYTFKGICISCWKWKTRRIQVMSSLMLQFLCEDYRQVEKLWAWTRWKSKSRFFPESGCYHQQAGSSNIFLLVISSINNTPKNVQTRYWWSKKKPQTYDR